MRFYLIYIKRKSRKYIRYGVKRFMFIYFFYYFINIVLYEIGQGELVKNYF